MKRYNLEQKRAIAGIRMVIPAMVILSVFILYPIVQSL
jgi:ABC-type sugar transport system permease subunit